ncbi:Cytochrome p450, partial [Thalictrum thalictroides]
MMSMKEDILQTLVVIVGVVLVSWAWKTISSIWLKPKKMEKYLREQGLKGPNYKFLYGDTKEIGRLTKEARSKPMENSHQIVQRVFPYYHQVVQQYDHVVSANVTDTPMFTCFLVSFSYSPAFVEMFQII